MGKPERRNETLPRAKKKKPKEKTCFSRNNPRSGRTPNQPLRARRQTKRRSKGLSPLAIAGIAVGGVAVLSGIAYLAFKKKGGATTTQEEMLTPIQEELSSQLTSLSQI